MTTLATKIETMPHPDEHSIEMYVLRPENLPESTRRDMAGHLSLCAGCRAVEESLRSFHIDFAHEAQADPARIAKLVTRAFSSPRIFHLRYYRPRPQISAGESYAGVLAAMTSSPRTGPGFETVASFASEHDHMLLRVRQDVVNRRVKIYYHADDPAKYAGAIVSLPALPAEIVLDDKGQMEFEIQEAKSPREWAALDVLVTLPLISLEVECPPPDEVRSAIVGAQESARREVTIENRGDRIEIGVASIGEVPSIHRLVVRDESGKNVLVTLSEGHASLTSTPSERILLRFYP
jgi:hypothetical protein